MEKSVKSSAVSKGVILGVVLSIITIIGYVAYQDLFTKWWLLFVLLFVIVGLGISSSVKGRKLLGGYISFKEAFTCYLITVAIGTLISTIVGILIFNVVDPDAAISIKEKSIETTVGFMENFNVPEEEIQKTVTQMEEQDTFGIGTQVKNWFWGMLIYIIIGLLASLVVKKNEPLH
ncbi:DUF4199 domain-containing protein [Aquimarina sp. 2201CG14-23]|uniref:DUF4199 domain-containing protein n=1 Tax=Aquimarina mycalae TaxID=3040073 RepID=UPI002477CD02|nr:DUF4199 domain-containing protein [Aquimarina sp. 2201CG14-23]MDH7447213.1 DUF4199 domain-containing protein [Aquimarina sp. 2201CG14-23]